MPVLYSASSIVHSKYKTDTLFAIPYKKQFTEHIFRYTVVDGIMHADSCTVQFLNEVSSLSADRISKQ